MTLGRWAEASAAGEVPPITRERNTAGRADFIDMSPQWRRVMRKTSGILPRTVCRLFDAGASRTFRATEDHSIRKESVLQHRYKVEWLGFPGIAEIPQSVACSEVEASRGLWRILPISALGVNLGTMADTLNISLAPGQLAWLRARKEHEGFASSSDVIRDLIRRHQEQERELLEAEFEKLRSDGAPGVEPVEEIMTVVSRVKRRRREANRRS